MATWIEMKIWTESKLGRYRDAFIYLLFTALFSILPTVSGYAMLKAFGKWTGDWSKLFENGDLLIASTSLMATSVYVFFHKAEARGGFLKSVSFLTSIIAIFFASLFYGAIALSAQGIIPPGVKMLPDAIVDISVVLYLLALCVGFHAFYSDRPPPSNLEVRDEQVSDLESELDQLGGGQ
jgi:hypothetical protein